MNRTERNAYKDKLLKTIMVPQYNENTKDKNEKSKAPQKEKGGPDSSKIDNFVKYIQKSLPMANYENFNRRSNSLK